MPARDRYAFRQTFEIVQSRRQHTSQHLFHVRRQMSFGSTEFMLPMRICAPASSHVMKTQNTTAVTKENLIQPIEDIDFFGQNFWQEFSI